VFDPEVEVAHLKAQFDEAKAEVWADERLPLQDKGPAIEELWQDFNRRREEIRSSAYQGEAPGEESPSSGRKYAPFLPRRRMPRWK
jgi:hypothetical protein